jgi:hypothetical protein
MTARVVVLREGWTSQHAREERAETENDPVKRRATVRMVGPSRPAARHRQAAVESGRQESARVHGKSDRFDLSDSFHPARQGCDEPLDRVHPWNC